CSPMSIPDSSIAWTASGWTRVASLPALHTRTPSGARARANPSAIWLRAELWTQRKTTARGGAATDSERALMARPKLAHAPSGGEALLAHQVLHELGVARGLAGVAIVEEQVGLARLVGELAQPLQPFAQLVLGVVVVVAIAALASPPGLRVAPVHAPGGAGARHQAQRRDEAGEARLVPVAVADPVPAQDLGEIGLEPRVVAEFRPQGRRPEPLAHARQMGAGGGPVLETPGELGE